MSIEYGRDRRTDMLARSELYLKDPWAVAGLIALGERVLRMELRRDDHRRAAWVFANPGGETARLVNELYDGSERSLMPLMLIRRAYREALDLAHAFEAQEKTRDRGNP